MTLALDGGFTDPPRQSALAFRAVLQAMARPGRIEELPRLSPPAPLSPAAAAVLLVLADPTTPLHLAPSHDTADLRAWLTFHTGAPLCGAEQAVLALGRWPDLQPVTRFRIGQPDYPDRSATLIIETDRLDSEGPRLAGPGIRDTARLSLPEAAAFQANRALFPLGFDCILTCGSRVAALPRSTRVEAA
ncbi:phosphonate C-P lyase system protein PhnH [Neotabrizicola shimadae]|uniref:Phosphonate C-P lyase system protein PhnH n=1 Tax=Neotabrizicola shimadae TaxID=2807096 RepID=A0A8G0ZW51_9RHOB|nr:phosphonate C-P lyase system protein PhnH [Neotabrizicola shimadae]QYZ69114.1 phosphonate C-P lyase system protein PhnH [Neotabrizicola shimadae]